MKPRLIAGILMALAAAATLPGCGKDSQDAAEAVDTTTPAATILDPVMLAPELAQQHLDAAREGHEQALEAQLEASEGGPAGSASAGD